MGYQEQLLWSKKLGGHFCVYHALAGGKVRMTATTPSSRGLCWSSTCAIRWSASSSYPFKASTTRTWRSLAGSEKQVYGSVMSRKAQVEAAHMLAGPFARPPLSLRFIPSALVAFGSWCKRSCDSFVPEVHMWGVRPLLALRGGLACVCRRLVEILMFR